MVDVGEGREVGRGSNLVREGRWILWLRACWVRSFLFVCRRARLTASTVIGVNGGTKSLQTYLAGPKVLPLTST